MSFPHPTGCLKEPIAEAPQEPGDIAYHMQYQRASSDFPYEHKFVAVHDIKMAYVDEGEGNPIVFVHGAPESAYIWRNIMPFVQPYARIVAPELPGHGKSDKPDINYEFADYVKYLDGFIGTYSTLLDLFHF